MMNLLHLEYFRELAYSEHLLETAKKLHVSAPTISSSLRNLENDLGVTLFDRVGRNMQLNDCGKALLPYVEQVFEAIQQGRNAVGYTYSKQGNRVAFSVRDAAFYSKVIEALNYKHPEIYINQYDCDPDDDGRLIDQLKLDFMVTDKDLKNPALDSCVLYEDRYVLMVSRKHPLARQGRTSCSLSELQDETFLYRPKSDYFQQMTNGLFERFGFVPAKSMEFEYVLRSLMLEKNLGVLITAERTLDSEFYRKSVVLHIEEFEGIRFSKKLYWKKDKKLPQAAETFRAYFTYMVSSPAVMQEELSTIPDPELEEV